MSLKLILDEIRHWEAERSQSRARDEAVRRQVAGAIGPILGERATARVLQPLTEDNSRLLSSVESVLVTFLGARAASRLVNRAMDRATMRS